MAAALGACRQSPEPEGQQQAERASAPDAKPGLSVSAARLVLPAVSGNPAAAYFTRGSGHNEKAAYTEREDDYINNVDRLNRKFESIRAFIASTVLSRITSSP